MAISLNRVQLIGNVTRDPEMRQIPGGQTVATFGVATNFSWNDATGNRQEKVEFHNVVVWRKLAEICGQYLKKGTKVFVEGRLQTREWEGEDGVKRTKVEIVAENVIFLDKKGSSSPEGGATYERSARSVRPEASAESSAGAVEETMVSNEGGASVDDLPF